MNRNKNIHIPVDYLNKGKERQQLTNFLRTGNFRKISGENILGERIKRRRRVLYVIAFLIFLIGFFYTLF